MSRARCPVRKCVVRSHPATWPEFETLRVARGWDAWSAADDALLSALREHLGCEDDTCGIRRGNDLLACDSCGEVLRELRWMADVLR